MRWIIDPPKGNLSSFSGAEYSLSLNVAVVISSSLFPLTTSVFFVLSLSRCRRGGCCRSLLIRRRRVFHPARCRFALVAACGCRTRGERRGSRKYAAKGRKSIGRRCRGRSGRREQQQRRLGECGARCSLLLSLVVVTRSRRANQRRQCGRTLAAARRVDTRERGSRRKMSLKRNWEETIGKTTRKGEEGKGSNRRSNNP